MYQPIDINPADPVDDHELAQALTADRHFACLASVTHMRPGDPRRLRRLPGVTGVIDEHDCAEVQLIVTASGPRAARRQTVERVADAVPEAVVTVPEVVDYDSALLTYLERHGDDPHHLPSDFDDAVVVADALDRV